MPGQPKFTRTMTVDVSIPDVNRYQPTLAEVKTKLFSAENTAAPGPLCEITPPEGYRVILLIAVGSAETDGDNFKLQTVQDGGWADVIPEIYLIANGHFNLTFPCWAPPQDDADGVVPRVRLYAAGTGNFTGYLLYYLEEV